MRVGDSIGGSIYNWGKDLFTFFVYLPAGHPVHPYGGCYNRNEPKIFYIFVVVEKHNTKFKTFHFLYKRVCASAGPSVGPFVGHSGVEFLKMVPYFWAEF